MADDGEVILHTDAGDNRVGINTTTPTKALQVTGDISASGDLTVRGATFNYTQEAAYDFEVKSQNKNHTLYVDSNKDKVGIGYNSPGGSDLSSSLHIAGDLTTDSHITASGNISQSNSTSTGSFGQIHIRNQLGVGTHQPDYDLDVAGTVGVANYIYHNGDENTYILFEDDKINLVAGGKSAYKFEHSTGKIQINNGNEDLDLQVMADDGEVILHTDAGDNRVGINTTTPTKALQVTGDISASGGFFVSSSGNTMINSDLTGSMATHLGALSVNYGNATQLTGSLTSNGDGYGDIVKFGGTADLAPGAIVYLKSDGSWGVADGTGGNAAAACSSSLLGVSLGTNSDEDGVLLRGYVQGASVGNNVVGQKLYILAHAAGKFDGATPGTSGNIVRVVGYSLTGGAEVYFNPDNTWVEVS